MMLMTHNLNRLPQQSRFNPAAVDQFIAQEMDTQRLPGLALAITQGDQVLYVKGYGADGDGKPVTPQTQFFIASVSKSFTALAVMQLVEAGKVSLDEPVQKYLPEFTLADPNAASQITIRQLLNHISGLSETGFPDMVLPQPQTIEERVTSLRSARPTAPPGTEYHYFSPNYGTLARVVEVVSGQPFAHYMQKHVFAPLAMANTFSAVTTAEGKRAAVHLAQGHLVIFGIPFAYPEADGYLGGSGGVISTAEDMAHYLIAQANGGRYDHQVLASPVSMDLMHTPPKNIQTTYAMGWTESTHNGRRILEHNGILSAYSADIVLLPKEEVGIVLLYNVNSLPTNAFAQPEIHNGLIALLIGQQPEVGWMNVRLWSWFTALLTIAGGGMAVRSLRQLPNWSKNAHTLPVWRLVPGILWTFVPALMLLWGIPAMTARFADRVFGFVNLYKSMMGIFTWLALTGLLGMINGIARLACLMRSEPDPRKEQPSVLGEIEHRAGKG